MTTDPRIPDDEPLRLMVTLGPATLNLAFAQTFRVETEEQEESAASIFR